MEAEEDEDVVARPCSPSPPTSTPTPHGIEEQGGDDWETSKSNPLNWSHGRKWAITLTACYMGALISIAGSSYSMGEMGMQSDLKDASPLLIISGISFFTFAVALFPLLLAPLGEELGRRYVYLVSYAIFFRSVGSTMVGGTLADIWTVEERSVPMALFALAALFGTPVGPIFFSWIGNHASWRWIHWIMLISSVPSAILVLIVFNQETLASMIRKREGYEEQKEGDVNSPITRIQRIRDSLQSSAIRPLVFLFTEPIATALCVWIAFAWGCLYLFLESIPLVFEPYGFDNQSGTRGLAFTGLAIGALLGFVTFVFAQRNAKNPSKPEGRLDLACVGGIAFAIGFFWYAWSAQPGKIHWIVPQMGTALLMWGLFLFYVRIFTYLSECYGPHTSSAFAAQSFLRNILATAFPSLPRRCIKD